MTRPALTFMFCREPMDKIKDSPPLIPPRKPRHSIEGLGDLVELGAKPLARAIDRVFGTDLVNCPSCEQRRQDWNAAVPFKKSP